MKNKIFIVLLLFALLFTGCAAKSHDSVEYTSGSVAAPAEGAADWDYDSVKGESQEVKPEEIISTISKAASTSEKIIYYANATVETLRFEETLEAVDAMIDKYSAFIETSSVTGNDYRTYYYKTESYRRANFVIRVPKEAYSKMSDELSSLGNLTSYDTSAQNITSQFVDTQSRLNTYRVEETRLLAMLEKADTVADMITIESRLSDVRYNIESLTSQLNNWQHQVDYSTVNLSIYEVKELSPEVAIPRSLGEEISEAFSKSVNNLVSFLRDALVVFIAALPTLALLAVIAVIIIIIVRASSKRRKKKLYMNQQNPDNSNDGPTGH